MNRYTLVIGVTLLLLLTVLMPRLSCEGGQRQQAQYDEGQNAYGRSDYDESIRLYGEVISAGGQLAKKTYFDRARSYEAEKEYQNAIQDFSEVIMNGGNDPAYYYDRGLCYYESGNYQAAAADFDAAIARTPAHQSTGYGQYCMAGKAWAALQNYTEAIDRFTKAIDIYPMKAEAYQCRGDAKHSLNSSQHGILKSIFSDTGEDADWRKARELASSGQNQE